MKRFQLFVATSILCLFGLATHSWAQEETVPSSTTSPSMGIFSEVVEVNIVNVLVTVTDKDGRPILGLTKEDFEVYEDGERVEISNFYEIQGTNPLAELDESEITPTQRWKPVGEGSDIRPAEIRYMAILVDHTAIERRNRKKVFAGVRDFISTELDSMDRLMLASFDGDYRVLQNFTNSGGDIISALDSLEKHPAGGTRIQQNFEQTLRSIEQTDLLPPTASGPGGGTTSAGGRRACPRGIGEPGTLLSDREPGAGGLPTRPAIDRIDALSHELDGRASWPQGHRLRQRRARHAARAEPLPCAPQLLLERR